MSDQMGVGVSPADEVVDGLPTVGAQLRAAREALGIPLPEVAGALKLGPRQLEALEDGNWKMLPGATFVRGFVRNYARFLQLDPVPLMVQLDMTLEKPVTRLGDNDSLQARMPQGGARISRRDRLVILAGGGLVVLAGLVYFLLPNDLSDLRSSTQRLLDSFSHKPAPVVVAEPAVEPVFPPDTTPQQVMNPQAETPAVTAPAPAPAALEPSAAPAPANPVAEKNLQVSGAVLMRFVFEKESWIEIRDHDKKVIFSQRGVAGSEQNLASGQGPFSLVIGYAPGVKLFWHGQAIDLAPYTHGDVARLVLE